MALNPQILKEYSKQQEAVFNLSVPVWVLKTTQSVYYCKEF